MFVNDWLPFARNQCSQARLRTLRITTMFYGLVAATIAWLGIFEHITILKLLLFGFAMVVPPAIAVAYLIYWLRTTEKAAFWGTVIGYGGGLFWYALIMVGQHDRPRAARGVQQPDTVASLLAYLRW